MSAEARWTGSAGMAGAVFAGAEELSGVDLDQVMERALGGPVVGRMEGQPVNGDLYADAGNLVPLESAVADMYQQIHVLAPDSRAAQDMQELMRAIETVESLSVGLRDVWHDIEW